jgi:hypothetical protein
MQRRTSGVLDVQKEAHQGGRELRTHVRVFCKHIVCRKFVRISGGEGGEGGKEGKEGKGCKKGKGGKGVEGVEGGKRGSAVVPNDGQPGP